MLPQYFQNLILLLWEIEITFYNVFLLCLNVENSQRNFISFVDPLLSAVLHQFLVTESSWQMMKNVFYFTLKALMVLKIFRLCLNILVMREIVWLVRWNWFQNLWHHNLVKKQLQYTFYPISQEVKAMRQWKLVIQENIT